jgi:hypothetical protein
MTLRAPRSMASTRVCGWAKQKALARNVAGQKSLRERRTLIGKMRLFADERDRLFITGLAQPESELSRCLAGTGDHHAQIHLSLGFVSTR